MVKRKKIIKWLKIRKCIFEELSKTVDSGVINFPDIHEDRATQVEWIQGRINLLDVLICGLEGKDEDHYIKTFEKWLK